MPGRRSNGLNFESRIKPHSVAARERSVWNRKFFAVGIGTIFIDDVLQSLAILASQEKQREDQEQR